MQENSVSDFTSKGRTAGEDYVLNLHYFIDCQQEKLDQAQSKIL
jgi:hypothetical protein